MNTRFRKFVNVPELMQLWLQVADMRRVDPAEIERPDLFNNKPVKVLSVAGQSLEDYVMKLAERAEKVRSGIVRPDEDNMLCITSDGRKAALDLSLVVPAPAGAPMPKLDELAEVVAQVTHDRMADVVFELTGIGELIPEQAFDMRPVPGSSSYEGPIGGLFLCGSGGWPGGCVMGAPGHNAAKEIIARMSEGRIFTGASVQA